MYQDRILTSAKELAQEHSPSLPLALSNSNSPPRQERPSSPSSPPNASSSKYLDSVGLSHRTVGDLGPGYGFQWRHFGAEYIDAETDYTGKGVDQLAEVIHKLKNNPYDRRIILSAWNPKDLKLMALPPCHMFAQFYVSFPKGADGERGKESCTVSFTRGAAIWA